MKTLWHKIFQNLQAILKRYILEILKIMPLKKK
ncbi:hypothetical protein SAMN05444483_1112 [Salegentibacter echinorum]|uniref:Uncharacterized protein n=1 Tax=Salegentibacter echinorum TaxID=1073325 RepID=A0A1M5JHJ4_SALEC|nr:hypothetical protein SAMN05444483_1112 [Salegentibacter echinorum]